MDTKGFERLTDGQKECLRLFHARFEVKDIARRIGRSPVTVHQRLAAARKHLGVDRSVEAARLLAEHEGGELGFAGGAPASMTAGFRERDRRPEASERAEPVSATGAAVTDGAPVARAGPASAVEQPSDVYGSPIYGTSMMGDPMFDRAAGTAEKPSTDGIPLPFPTRDRPVNDLSVGAKLIYVVVLAALIALVFGGMVAALTGLSELF